MASHRKPRTPPLSGHAARAAATLATAAAASVGALAQPGHADSQPAADQVMAQTGAPYQQATQATRQDGSAETAGEAQQKDDAQQPARRTTDVRPNTLCGRHGGMAALQYRNGTLDPELQLLMSAHPDDDLRRAGDLSEALASQTGLFQQVGSQSRSFAAQRVTARTRLSALQAEQRRLAAAKEQIQRQLAAARQLQDSLDVAVRDVHGAAFDGSGSARADVTPPSGLGSLEAPSRGALAVAFARAQVGKPDLRGGTSDVRGGTDPGACDCARLVQAAWGAAGVALPHTAYEQISTGRRVSAADLRPGDLVFYAARVSHVGLYIGNGGIIHAPHREAPVVYAPVGEMPIVGAVRPG